MSDEIIEGRDIRNRPSETPPVQEAPPPAPESRRSKLKGGNRPKAEDEKSGPYVTLTPPDEAGDPIRAQADEPTFHKGMKPILAETAPAGEPAPPDEADPSAPAPDLPWDVIDTPATPAVTSSSDSLMKLPRVPLEEPPAAQAEEAPQPAAPAPAPTGPRKPRKPAEPPRIGGEFIPQLHTPTEELPPVPDEVAAEPAAAAEIPVEPIIEEEIPPIRRAEDSLTPGVLRRVPDEDEAEREIPPIRRGERREVADEDTDAQGQRRVALEDDTAGGLPKLRRMVDPVTGEVVDADWVREVGPGAPPQREPKRPRGRGVEDAIAERLEARRAQAQRKPAFRLNLRTILTIISILALIALAIYIPLRLGLFGGTGGPGNTPTLPPSPTAPTGAGPLGTPSAQAAAGGLPYQQGRLAFASNRDGNYEIYVLDMASGAISQLTRTDAPVANRFPAWSPDGKRIVYVSNSSGNDDLYVIPAAGGQPVQLTSDPGSDRNPAWSPDGKTIASSRENVDGSRLVSMPTSCIAQPTSCEGQIKMLTPGGYDRFPAWAPNGLKLAFTASNLPGSASVIGLLNPDGSGYQSFAGTKTSDLNPAWSPDGTKIAFLSYAEGDYDLWVMYSDGTGVTQVTKSKATDGAPAWSPDGKYLVFASDRDDKQHFNLYLLQTDCLASGVSCEDNLIRVTNEAADDLDPAWIQ